jgi:hypothetical protein
MFYRPPVVANKARGTMSSSTYTPMKGAIWLAWQAFSFMP